MTSWDYGHMDGGWGVVMVLGTLAFWGLVALAVVWLVRTTGRSQPPSEPRPGNVTAGAEQILAERLARGEIEPEDYRARLAAITRSG